MRNKRSICLYIDKEVLEIAKQMGLNVSKACSFYRPKKGNGNISNCYLSHREKAPYA